MPSKLEELQMQFRQRLKQEKEERLIKSQSDNLQQKGTDKVKSNRGIPRTQSPVQNRNSYAANSNAASTSYKPNYFPDHRTSPSKRTSPGVDRSRPLPPIKRGNKTVTSTYQTYSNSTVPGYGYGTAVDEIDNNLKALGINNSSSSDSNGKKTNGEIKKSYNSPRSKEQSDTKRSLAPKRSTNGSSEVKQDTFTASSQSNGSRLKNHSTKVDHEESGGSKQRLKQDSKNGFSRKNGNGLASQGSRLTSDPSREECSVCGRRFARDRIETHISICMKSAQKKRKTFDITKMRVKGTEAEKYVRRGMHLKEDHTHASKKMDWRKKHEEFINNIRQAKAVQRHLAAGGKLSDLPPPPPLDTSDYVRCPYCDRKFNEAVAERHIPKCKNIICNKKPTYKTTYKRK